MLEYLQRTDKRRILCVKEILRKDAGGALRRDREDDAGSEILDQRIIGWEQGIETRSRQGKREYSSRGLDIVGGDWLQVRVEACHKGQHLPCALRMAAGGQQTFVRAFQWCCLERLLARDFTQFDRTCVLYIQAA